jgi:hypothetical protein
LDCYGVREWELLYGGSDWDAVIALMRLEGRLETACNNATDYSGLLRRRGWHGDVEQAIDYLLSERERGEVLLGNVPEGDAALVALESRGGLIRTREVGSWCLELPSSSVKWPGEGCSTSVRTAKRALARAVRDGAKVEFTQDRGDFAFDEMVGIHTRLWESRGQAGNFGDERRVRFVDRILDSDIDWLLGRMCMNGQTIAYRLGFFGRDRFYAWNCGYDPEFARVSAGSALVYAELEEVRRRPEIRTYDFLRGDEEWKSHWAKRREIVVYGRVRSTEEGREYADG